MIVRTISRALFAFVGALLFCSTIPATAQINLPRLGDAVSGTVSTRQEQDLGQEFLRSVRAQAQILDDPLMKEYIINLTYKLALHSELSSPELHFVLIDSPELNAFAAPGGIIGVNAGLFLSAQNEGQFASVLAHELAHLSQRHYARNVEQARNSAITNAAGLLASLVIMATAGSEAGQAALMTSQAIGVDNRLRFSRSFEQEADRIGIRNLYNAGFDPDDMAGMFRQMLQSRGYGERPPEFLSTHPLDENRIADSRNRALSMPEVNRRPNLEYLLMRERAIMHYSARPEAEVQARMQALDELSGDALDAARYGIALGQLRTGRYVDATQQLDLLLAKEPSRISYVMLAAEIAMAEKDFERATAILRDSLRTNPDNHPLTMTYAQALNGAGQHQRAADLLEKHAAKHPNDMQLWYDLAEIQGQAGNIPKVHIARAEYFICIGDFARARDQLNYALSLVDDRLLVARIRQRQEYIREIQNKFYR